MSIQWICEYCGVSIEDGQGYLTIPRDALDGAADWRVLHSGCDLEEPGMYVIEVERIRGLGQALEWTSHLMGKTWVQRSNWDDLMRIISERRDGAA